MAKPVIQSSNTNTGSTTTSLVITKPTGLAEGDFLFASLALYDINDANRSWSTPSGWTAVTASGTGSGTNIVRTAVFYKVATSGDIAASDFTFAVSGTVGYVSGYLARITGVNGTPIAGSESDNTNSGTTSSSFTTSLTPTVDDSLLIFNFAGNDPNASTETVSSYASNPSATWTELADIGIESGGDGLIHGVASAEYSGTSTISSRSALFSETAAFQASSAVVLSGTIDASATADVELVSPTFFSVAGSAGEAGSSDLFTASPTSFSVSGFGDNSPVWSNSARPTFNVEELNAVTMGGNNRVYMNGDNKIYRSSDGRSWTNQTRP